MHTNYTNCIYNISHISMYIQQQYYEKIKISRFSMTSQLHVETYIRFTRGETVGIFNSLFKQF